MKQPKMFSLLAGVAGVALVLTGCSTAASESSDEASTGELRELRVVVNPVTDAASLYLAQEEGIFAEHGLDVELTVGQGGSAIAAALQSGEADLGVVNYVTVFSGRQNDLPLKLATPLSVSSAEEAGIYVAPDSGLETLADLKGKRFGLVGAGSIADLATMAALENAGVAADSIEHVQVPMPNLVSSVTQGQVDFIFMNSPFTLQAEAAGLVRIHDAFSGELADLPSAAIAASEKWISENGETLEAFRAALIEASELANGDNDLVRPLLPSYTSLDAEQAKVVSIPVYAGDLPHAEVQRIADLMTKFGFLKESMDVKTALAW